MFILREFLEQRCPLIFRWAEENVTGDTEIHSAAMMIAEMAMSKGFRKIDCFEHMVETFIEIEEFLTELSIDGSFEETNK